MYNAKTNANTATLSAATKLLHLVVAIGMLTLIPIGIYMSENDVYSLYPIHKSVGAIIFLVALARVIWRMKQGWPTPLSDSNKLQQAIAKLIHWLLITATVMYPLSGLMMSLGGGRGLSVFGLELVPVNLDSEGEIIALNNTIAGIGHDIHGILVPIVLVAVMLHIVGALKHHVVNKDATLKRMFSLK